MSSKVLGVIAGVVVLGIVFAWGGSLVTTMDRMSTDSIERQVNALLSGDDTFEVQPTSGRYLNGLTHIFEMDDKVVVRITYSSKNDYDAGLASLEEMNLSLATVTYDWSILWDSPGVICLEFEG